MWVVSKSFKAVFKCLRTTVINKKYISEEIKSSFNLGNGCYSSVHINLFVLSESIKMKFYKGIILLIMCGCQTWYLTLREEHKLRLFENIVLRKLLGPKRLEGIRGRYQTA
jgi:hypothetical protein